MKQYLMKWQIDENESLMKKKYNEKANLMKWQVDELVSWWIGKLMKKQSNDIPSWCVSKLMKYHVDGVASWHNAKLIKPTINETTIRWNGKLIKCLVDKMTCWWNDKLIQQNINETARLNVKVTKQQVDKMAIRRNIQLTKCRGTIFCCLVSLAAISELGRVLHMRGFFSHICKVGTFVHRWQGRARGREYPFLIMLLHSIYLTPLIYLYIK